MKEEGLNILLVDDEEEVRHVLGEFIKGHGHHVVEAGDGASTLQLLEHTHFHLAFVDIQMPGLDGLSLLSRINDLRPDLKVVIFTGFGTMEVAIQSFRLGAMDFLQKPINYQMLAGIIDKIQSQKSEGRDAQGERKIPGFSGEIPSKRLEHPRLIGTSEIINEIRKSITRVVSSYCDTVIIKGETGTGKEVVAHEIHYAATLNNAPFIAVSCPAISDTLIESELFGHVKGSFTGATTDRIGYFELAQNGTLFLDEIADLTWLAQAKLLRIIETRTFRPLGSPKEKFSQVRLLAATNKSLENLTKAGKFRPDLYYRLQAFSIYIPPLREHAQDIIPLASYFVDLFSVKKALPPKRLTESACCRLLNYSYPGNVRELRNVVERAAIISQGTDIEAGDIVFDQASQDQSFEQGTKTWEQEERTHLKNALEQARWNRKEAAKILNMPYSTFRHKIKKFNICK